MGGGLFQPPLTTRIAREEAEDLAKQDIMIPVQQRLLNETLTTLRGQDNVPATTNKYFQLSDQESDRVWRGNVRKTSN
jgi:hypothetical protein